MADNPQQEKQMSQSSFFREWLEKLQQESWQLELLISGFALFGIWEARSFIMDLSEYVNIHRVSGFLGMFLDFASMILKAGWLIFFVNLIIHIILRGLWIGAIGLRYVSQDINYDQLNYSAWMTNYLRRKVGDYDDFIERLEKVCSVLFAFTFLLFFLIMSGILFAVELIGLGGLIALVPQDSVFVQFIAILVLAFLFGGALVFIDFITTGVFRKVKDPTFAKAFGYLYRFFSYATLSFMYRPLLYNFLDNRFTKRLFLFSIPYIIALLFVTPKVDFRAITFFPDKIDSRSLMYKGVSSYYVDPNNYDDLRLQFRPLDDSKRLRLITPVINHYRYQKPGMQIFIPLGRYNEDYLNQMPGYEPYHSKGLLFDGWMDKKWTIEDSLNAERETEMGNLIELKQQERNRLKETGNYNNVTKAELESKYTPKIDSIRESYKRKIIKAYNDQTNKVMQYFRDGISLLIDNDTVDITSRQLRYTVHPNRKEPGLILDVDISNLAYGEHILECNISRSSFSSQNKTYDNYVNQTFIPFFTLFEQKEVNIDTSTSQN